MRQLPCILLVLNLAGLCGGAAAPGTDSSRASAYTLVVSRATASDPAWQTVVQALERRHEARVVTWDGKVDSCLDRLRAPFPRRVAFVAQRGEVTRSYVAAVHQIMRQLDDDPYTDALWGIVTGYDAANALRIVQTPGPLVIRKVAAGTEVALEPCESGVWYSELKPGVAWRKVRGGNREAFTVPQDTSGLLAAELTEGETDLFVTSGHATERDWEIGYAYRNGRFVSADGGLYAENLQGQRTPIRSDRPRVYLPVGNCLMGHIDGPDAMALAFMNSAGVRQMMGYTVPTWYGYAGWGCLDYFVEQPSRYTFVEAFVANHHALVHRLSTFFPGLGNATIDEQGRTSVRVEVSAKAREAGLSAQDGRGLLFDRDQVAVYGDPGWEARMAPQPLAWVQELKVEGDIHTFEVRPQAGAASFDAVNRNGSQRGGRPFVHFLPGRVGPVTLLEGAEWDPVVTDDFVLVPRPAKCDPARTLRVVFRARAMGGGSTL